VRNAQSSSDVGAARRSSLSLVEAFRDLPAEQLADLEQRLITLSIRRGEVLVRQGEEADALYIVASGRFAVDVDGRRVAEVGSGSPIWRSPSSPMEHGRPPSRRSATRSC
jgi:Cyclic nucleotide-binding domain